MVVSCRSTIGNLGAKRAAPPAPPPSPPAPPAPSRLDSGLWQVLHGVEVQLQLPHLPRGQKAWLGRQLERHRVVGRVHGGAFGAGALWRGQGGRRCWLGLFEDVEPFCFPFANLGDICEALLQGGEHLGDHPYNRGQIPGGGHVLSHLHRLLHIHHRRKASDPLHVDGLSQDPVRPKVQEPSLERELLEHIPVVLLQNSLKHPGLVHGNVH
mmetsp:Transcript_37804/g.84544  ORF Transcript_37804/g.84544 Transcript_37804/m.84544 type:complete len:211 (+) Transcript_37804:21-653(+)